MGFPSGIPKSREPEAHGLERSIPSSNRTARHQPCDCDQQHPKNAFIRYLCCTRPIKDNSEPSNSSNPRIGHKVFHRSAKELHDESFYSITLEKRTNYPCTQKDLDVSGGENRRSAVESVKCKDKSQWFAHPNKGPFIDARKATREIFDHNDLKRRPSAAEDEAIRRLRTGLERAVQEPWGPDLAIKAFCDLDEVFFCGRLRGHVCLTWRSGHAFPKTPTYGTTHYLGNGKCAIQLNSDNIFLLFKSEASFAWMFATVLHEMSHAYFEVRALDHGPTGWMAGKAGGHGKNFGTMMHAVNRRAWELLRLGGDRRPYMRHDYAYDDEPSPPPKQPPPHNPTKVAATANSRRKRYNEAFMDVSQDSGSDYPCRSSDLEATGGLARQKYPDDNRKDRKKSHNQWFPHQNHGPFVTARQATRDVFKHNKPNRKPGTAELEAIGRLSNAVTAARAGTWGPDLIIKAFCDLDIVFFGGRLRGHVCVRWLRDWSERGHTVWGTTVFLGKGKCSVKLNAETILLENARPFDIMFSTMLHEMCHAYAHTQVEEKDFLASASHGKNFGTKFYAVDKRAKELFGLTLISCPGENYPQFDYKNREGLP